MIDHVAIRVSDMAASKAFYDRALAPLGWKVVWEAEDTVGWGDGESFFGIRPGDQSSVHVAFSSPNRVTVDAFYDAALGAGAADNGPPGLRPDYHESYYAAFVHDPDGHNIEAVCHVPEAA